MSTWPHTVDIAMDHSTKYNSFPHLSNFLSSFSFFFLLVYLNMGRLKKNNKRNSILFGRGRSNIKRNNNVHPYWIVSKASLHICYQSVVKRELKLLTVLFQCEEGTQFEISLSERWIPKTTAAASFSIVEQFNSTLLKCRQPTCIICNRPVLIPMHLW